VTSIGDWAFNNCTKLTSAEFFGAAPSMKTSVFSSVSSEFTVKYHGATSGFTSPTWMGYPSVDLDPIPPFAIWQASKFTLDDIATGLTVPAADFDHDGLSNLLEYAFGKNPKVADMAGIVPNISGNKMQISFPCDAACADISYTVQASSNLSTWNDIAKSSGGSTTVPIVVLSAPLSTVSDSGLGLRTVTVTETLPITGKRFVRVKVTTP